ncbi:hypothetical protein CDAR_66651 [Caerostris darwini]|uniref:Uncharacterized protein n=1 Tax=Caerostris darwini TaxID=1538125 RepID=A0AAV4T567_9ARAC|nr:hypothetical protein CDAR_66651 [Caerostris darwini]
MSTCRDCFHALANEAEEQIRTYWFITLEKEYNLDHRSDLTTLEKMFLFQEIEFDKLFFRAEICQQFTYLWRMALSKGCIDPECFHHHKDNKNLYILLEERDENGLKKWIHLWTFFKMTKSDYMPQNENEDEYFL